MILPGDRSASVLLTVRGVLMAVLVLAAFQRVRAQVPERWDGGPAPVVPASGRPLLVDVEFEGNASLSDGQILARIATRPTRPLAIMKFFGAFGVLMERNPLAPDSVRMQVRRTNDSLGGDLRYLKMSTLLADTIRIADLYDDYGYHDARVGFRIRLDTLRNTSIVRFIIEEGPGFPVKEVTYLGLDEVPAPIREEAVEPLYLRNGERYTKDKYVAQVDQVVDVLRNNGYAFAATGEPAVLTARPPVVAERFDSILVYIYAGDRYRFGQTVNDPDTISDADAVDSTLILDQTEYSPGEWYSREQVEQTVANLYALGTFNLVTIDTAGSFSSDSVLGMRISTRLREQNDLRIAPEIRYDPYRREGGWNAGISASYTRLNVLGRAEQLSVSGRLLAAIRNGDFQGGASIAYSVPSLAGSLALWGRRPTLVTTLGYDFSVLDRVPGIESDVRLLGEQFTASMALNYMFGRYRVSVRATGRKDAYIGIAPYLGALAGERVNDDHSRLDSLGCNAATVVGVVRDALINTLYRVQVLQGDDPSLAAALDHPPAPQDLPWLKYTLAGGVGMVFDTRDNYFTPAHGKLWEMMLDAGLTGALSGGFARVEMGWRQYGPAWSGNWTYAYRVHGGYILELGEMPLTPASSRFFSGGANSNRGWYSRDMLATGSPELTGAGSGICAAPIIAGIVAENRRLLGGLALLESNMELRWKPFRSAVSSGMARRLVFVFFVDAGNAFFRDGSDADPALLRKIGVATGASVGYETPFGPFRVGLGVPVYDPLTRNPDDAPQWITERELPSAAVLHVGIGHAF